MLKWTSWRYILGGTLVIIGVLALLQVLGYLSTSGNVIGLVFAVLFAALGVSFLMLLGGGPQNWWAAIPGTILVFLGALILFSVFAPSFADHWGGPFFLFGISLAFLIVYFMAPQNWWAIIPGGVMLTLAVVAGIPTVGGDLSGGIFFLGMAATFFVLWLIPVQGRRMAWPWIPGVVLAAIGVLILLSSASLVVYVWPLILIAGGVALLARAALRRA